MNNIFKTINSVIKKSKEFSTKEGKRLNPTLLIIFMDDIIKMQRKNTEDTYWI